MKPKIGLDIKTSGNMHHDTVAAFQFYIPDKRRSLFLPINMAGLPDEQRVENLEKVQDILGRYSTSAYNQVFAQSQIQKVFPGLATTISGCGSTLAKMAQQKNYSLKDLVINQGLMSVESFRKLHTGFHNDTDFTQVQYDDPRFLRLISAHATWAWRVEDSLRNTHKSLLASYEEDLLTIPVLSQMYTDGITFNHTEFSRWFKKFTKSGASPFVSELSSLEAYLPPATGKSTNRGVIVLHPNYSTVGRHASPHIEVKTPPIDSYPLEFRKFLLPSEDEKLIHWSWRDAEIAIMAYWAQDYEVLDLYHSDEDFHSVMASKILETEITELSPEAADVSKSIFRAGILGESIPALAKTLGLDPQKTEDLFLRCWTLCTKMNKLRGRIIRESESAGARTITGRCKMFPGISSPNPEIRQKSQSEAIQFAIQGSVADLQKICLRTIHSDLKERSVTHTKFLITQPGSFTLRVPESLPLEKISGYIAKRSILDVKAKKIHLLADVREGANYFDVSV